MNPLQISADTAIELAKKLNVPLEQLMHMPKHILMQKLMEAEQGSMEKKEDK
ncbi:YycC family protein [Lottiidibacillus patelloidae]|uniref:YycC family protein n=1 Tax=Lottiidibacillus patelloidae TaxID=2670334 RepID=A0A263BV34_9BACI|nr:YycC family protein [Lottiidibacillus patelloidae]OZM57611.1 YycC family protein [Lottiidibacillus patelloidae]